VPPPAPTVFSTPVPTVCPVSSPSAIDLAVADAYAFQLLEDFQPRNHDGFTSLT